jgi:hypothetical protein
MRAAESPRGDASVVPHAIFIGAPRAPRGTAELSAHFKEISTHGFSRDRRMLYFSRAHGGPVRRGSMEPRGRAQQSTLREAGGVGPRGRPRVSWRHGACRPRRCNNGVDTLARPHPCRSSTPRMGATAAPAHDRQTDKENRRWHHNRYSGAESGSPSHACVAVWQPTCR